MAIVACSVSQSSTRDKDRETRTTLVFPEQFSPLTAFLHISQAVYIAFIFIFKEHNVNLNAIKRCSIQGPVPYTNMPQMAAFRVQKRLHRKISGLHVLQRKHSASTKRTSLCGRQLPSIRSGGGRRVCCRNSELEVPSSWRRRPKSRMSPRHRFLLVKAGGGLSLGLELMQSKCYIVSCLLF